MKTLLYSAVYVICLLFLLSCNEGMIGKGLDSTEDPRRPDINVKQGTDNIISGADYGPIAGVSSGSVSSEIEFIIENLGSSDLELTGSTPVQISGTDSLEFSISEQPSETIIAPGRNAVFSLTFDPITIGDKSAILTIENNDLDESEYTITLNATTKPAPDFTARVRKGIAPLTVSFEDNTVGDVTTYRWNFGDGTISSEKNPVHSFEAGNYTVELRATGNGGEAYKYKINYVVATTPIRHVIESAFYSVSAIYPGDLDNNGTQDIVASSWGGNEISWWKNAGNGIFGIEHQIYDGSSDFPLATSVMTADIDNDGYADVIASSYNNDTNADISWFENDGTGTSWIKHDVTTTFTYCSWLYVANIDNDLNKRLDIVAVSKTTDEVAYWINNGGTFGSKNTITTTFDLPNTVTVSDIDKDKKMDIIAGSTTEGISYWLGSDSFATEHVVPDSACNPVSIYCADIDKDGNKDIIAAQSDTDEIVCWLNLVGGFEKHVLLSGFNAPTSVYSIDVDLDGDYDIISTSAMDDDIVWLENKGGMTFTKHLILGSYDGASCVFSTDINGDGKRDIISAAAGAQSIDWWEIYSQWAKTEVNTEPAFFTMAKESDIDGDGDSDIVTTEKDSDTLSWWQNDGSGNFMRKFVIDSDFKQANSVTAIDIDKDGDQDIFASANEGGVAWWENSDVSFPGSGDGSVWLKHVIDDSFSGYNSSIISADVNLDNNPDIIGYRNYTSGSSTAEIALWVNDGLGNFSVKETVFSESTGSAFTFFNALTLDCSDLDGDSYPDIVAGFPKFTSTLIYSGRLSWFRNLGGYFGTEQSIDTTTPSINSLKISDINKDGVKDIAGCWFYPRAPYTNEVCWWRNEGDGNGDGSNDVVISNSTKEVIDSDFKNPVSLSIADIDGDVKDDIVAGCYRYDSIDSLSFSYIVWYKGNNSGSFSGKYPINNNNFMGLNYITTLDVDGDGDLEVVGASGMNDGANELAVWENNLEDWGL